MLWHDSTWRPDLVVACGRSARGVARIERVVMAIMWFAGAEGWRAVCLAPGAWTLVEGEVPVSRWTPGAGPARGVLWGRACPDGADEQWFLLDEAGVVHVNGERLRLGIRALCDHDELRLAGSDTRFYWSLERQVEVVLFPMGAEAIVCARCQQPMEAGALAVRCPQCRTWHHQSERLPCWLYDTRCAVCPQNTSPDAGLAWSPGLLQLC